MEDKQGDALTTGGGGEDEEEPKSTHSNNKPTHQHHHPTSNPLPTANKTKIQLQQKPNNNAMGKTG
jgi:hypothetical protein